MKSITQSTNRPAAILMLLLSVSSLLTENYFASADNAAAGSKPNILYLLVDDWGAGDVDMCPDDTTMEECPFSAPKNSSRRQHLHTPRIKQMAREGMIMSNFYAPRAVCSPSRAAMFTGRDPTRYGLTDNIFRVVPGSYARSGLPPQETTFANYLKDVGYSTGYSGK